MPKPRRVIPVALAAVALLAAGCGGGGDEDDAGPRATSTASSTAPPVAGPPAPAVPATTLAAGPARSRTPAPWPAPTGDVVALIRKAGLTPLDRERFEYHIHDHLDVFVDGVPKTVAGGIGIDLRAERISPLHTHEPNGVIHIENSEPIEVNLRQLFIQWDVETSADCIGGYCTPQTSVAIYVNGLNRGSDASKIEILGSQEIAVVIGKPPAKIPDRYDFSAVGGSVR